MVDRSDQVEPIGSEWRLRLGIGVFVLSIVTPLVGVPFVTSLDITVQAATTISGGILAVSEGMGIAAIAIMGKSGYVHIKSLVGGFIRRIGPPVDVSRTRYRIGLILIAIPVVFGWASPYLASVLPALNYVTIPMALAADALLIVGLFVVGGGFWEKVRALFVHDARGELR